MEINEIKYGFQLVSVKEINDISSTLYEYVHLKSGGRVAYLACDDTNCCFAIGFRTLPEDSTGVCHIIEHSLLCGSKKYPLKEPFVNLIKSSLATFLNAFTASDWTMYPFASQTPKDFDNILSIYCDAVFNPISVIDPKPFLQEGWHLELLNEDDIPQYKGVVYNEMKGAMSSVDEVLGQATLSAMYKDTFYRFNSGGDPDVIPSLTYEAYKDFYYRHYTPQNAMTYFYGKLDIEAKLKFLDEEYFSKYDKKEEIVIVPQEPFIDLNYEMDYEIGAEEDVKDNTYMSLCYRLGNENRAEDSLAMHILCDVLLSKNDSPLKKALLDAKLGQNILCRIDDDNIVPALHIYLQKTNKNKKEEFKNVLENTVRKLVEEGIDKDLLLAAINYAEFKDKELNMGRMPKGLVFAMSMMGSFNYREGLETSLEVFKYYDKFKKELNNGYFEKKLEQYILNSKHHVQVVINPSKTLAASKKEAMDKLMKETKQRMTSEEIKALVSQTNDLIAYQNHVDTKEELATLPSLEIKDIPSTVNYLESKETKVGNLKAITHTLNTNKIAYLRMYFNLKGVEYDDLPYVTLLRELLLNVGTKKYQSIELSKIIKTYLGGMSCGLIGYSMSKDEADLCFTVSTSSLVENVNYIPKILNEVLLKSKFTRKTIKQILQQVINDIRRGIIENGNSVAANMALENISINSNYLANLGNGPKLYDRLNKMLKDFNYHEIKGKLEKLTEIIFNESNVLVSLSGDKQTISSLKKAVKKIKLNHNEVETVLKDNRKELSDRALVIPSGVSYNAIGNNLSNYNVEYNGRFAILSHIVNYDYLWNEIRVKGGAYGCGMSISNTNDFILTTYRDPNVNNSYEVFEKLPKYIENLKLSKDEFTSYIIGAFSGFDAPVSTPLKINIADNYYIQGITKKDRIKLKKEVLNTKLKDLKALVPLLEKAISEGCKCSIGNEIKIGEHNFDEVNSL